jgi:integrase
MARPPLPLGSYGKITFLTEGKAHIARVQFRDFDGIVRTVKRTGKSKAAAERALKAALVERQAPIAQAQLTGACRFSKAAELWFAEFERLVEDGQRSPGTLDTYRYIYGTHVLPALGALRVREVTTPVVDRTVSAIKVKSNARARTSKVIISGVMRYAVRHGAAVVNPVREVARIDGTPKRRPRALTAEERQQWLDAVEGDQRSRDWDLPDLTRMMLATGCRIGECLAIGWTEVDLDAATVDVCWRLIRRKGAGLLRVPSTKSGERGERLIPLPGWAVDMLRQRRVLIGPGVDPVFPDSLGGWRDPSNVRRVWRAVRNRAEMEGVVTHTLRKTVASFLDDANVSVRKISDQLGHAKVSMTQDRYLGRRLTDRQTAEVLEGLFEVPAEVNRPKTVREES